MESRPAFSMTGAQHASEDKYVRRERAAVIYTIIKTAKLNGVDPKAYMRDMLKPIAEGHPINGLDDLVPWNSKA